MGVRLIHDAASARDNTALYDSVSGWAFGPVFNSVEDAESFLDSLPKDARLYRGGELATCYAEWRDAHGMDAE